MRHKYGASGHPEGFLVDWNNVESVAALIKTRSTPLDYTVIIGRKERLYFLGESHSNVAIRTHLQHSAGALSASGITHLLIESDARQKSKFEQLFLGDNIDINMLKCGPVGETHQQGYRTMVSAMIHHGIRVIPIDVNMDQPGRKLSLDFEENREQFIAANIATVLNNHPGAKIAVLIGRAHTHREYHAFLSASGRLALTMGHPSMVINYCGGSVKNPQSILQAARISGHNDATFAIDIRSYQSPIVIYGQGNSDWVVHLPQT